jgi:ABC-type glutathione transport system ATPase component
LPEKILTWWNLRKGGEMMIDSKKEQVPARPLIGVVGPCGSGKSTLTEGLASLGYTSRHIAQEHSYVKDMWQRLTNPDILVFLDASWATTSRRLNLNWTEAEWQEQQFRLRHAREHADLVLETDDLSIAAVLARVLRFVDDKIAGGA